MLLPEALRRGAALFHLFATAFAVTRSLLGRRIWWFACSDVHDACSKVLWLQEGYDRLFDFTRAHRLGLAGAVVEHLTT